MHADSKVSGTRRRKNYEGGRKKKGATADNADGADKAENEAVWICFAYPCYPRYPRFKFLGERCRVICADRFLLSIALHA